jgi:hypothetical protein
VPTGLDPAQARGIGHPTPPGSRPLTSVPPAQPTSVPAAPANPQTAHPSPPRRPGARNPRLGSERERPPEHRPDLEPTIIQPIVNGGSGADTSLRGSLRANRPDLWAQLPHEARLNDKVAALWLFDNTPAEWWKFADWLRGHNRPAYSRLPESLKLPEDRRATAPTRTTASLPSDNALEGYLIVWLKEKGWWDAIPANRKHSERHSLSGFTVKGLICGINSHNGYPENTTMFTGERSLIR